MGLQGTCDVFFGLFMAAWVATRHVFYNMMVWSCIRYARSLEFSTKPVQGNWAMGRAATWSLVGLLAILQCILFVWLTMIFKVAWKVISGQSAEDSRSDEESNDEEEEKVEQSGLKEETQSITASTSTSLQQSTATARLKQKR